MALKIIHFRDGTIDDLDAIVDITIASLELDPQWPWRFPYRKEFPEDHRKYTKEALEKYFTSGDKYKTRVAEIEDSGTSKVIAHAVYDVTNLNPSQSEGGENAVHQNWKQTMDKRPDASKERMLAMMNRMGEIKAEWQKEFGHDYIYLALLCTHPDYFGKGAAGPLLRWGIDLAKEKNVRITLLASPMGRPVYVHVGYKDTGDALVSCESDGTTIVFGNMVYSPTP